MRLARRCLLYTSGLVIHRDLVETTLRAAADRLSLPTGMFSTHSLRAGGATAMWAAKYSVEEIQRRGRWVTWDPLSVALNEWMVGLRSTPSGDFPFSLLYSL